ncbi:hypothetical protein GCM10010307_29090 [Streptomyces vastus]|uniref:DUF418 domain-containing protein n=1 Tax=Streptomyces vastus TaxID=285451 RepID=A0ABN3QSH4_9ACTN
MIVGATVAMDRLPRLRLLAKPVIAVGTMSLTAYVGHFVVQSALSMPSRPAPSSPGCRCPQHRDHVVGGAREGHGPWQQTVVGGVVA